ncbi:DUF308 domain-containing protein [Rhodococcus koreensis]|uniref:DUF308 domain-containing protein n=1 Tax=Rhodococcus koreensis TaxID=99653 RepID=UPI0036D84B68
MTLPRGILAVLFGAGALVWPGITVWGLTVVFGVYAITGGAVRPCRAVAVVGCRGAWPARSPWPGPTSPRSCST